MEDLPKGWKAYKLKDKKNNWAVYAYIITVILFGLFIILFTNQTAAESIDTNTVLDSKESRQEWNVEFDDSAVDFCGLSYVTCPTEEQEETLEAIEVLAVVSAYSEIDSCYYEGCPMANGIKAQVGYVACPRDIPLGTKATIDTMGEFICGDRTAKFVDGRIDVFMGYGQEAYDEAIQFGIKNLAVAYDRSGEGL